MSMVPTPTAVPVYRVVHQPRPGTHHSGQIMLVGALLAFVVFPLSVLLPFIWLPVVPLLILQVLRTRRRDAAAFALRHQAELSMYGSVRKP